MYKATLAGHALHPQLVLTPGGLLPFSAILDWMYQSTGHRKYADAARITIWGGLAGGALAAAAGAVDYYSIQRGTEVKRTANMHASMNIALMGLWGVNLFLRRGNRRPGATGIALSTLGAAGLLVSAWYGAKMSYEQGVRVKNVDPLQNAKDLKLPGDDQIAQTFDRLEEKYAGYGGPSAGEPNQLSANYREPVSIPSPT